jgi:hypothetical protein
LLHIPDVNLPQGGNMRGIAILIAALVTLSVMVRPHEAHLGLHPTSPMPPVNVP